MRPGLELLLVPWFQRNGGNGGLGVVVSFAVSELLLFLGLLRLISGVAQGTGMALNLARTVGSASLTAGVLVIVPTINPWLAVPLCIAIYTAASLGVGLLRRKDLLELRGLLPWRSR